MPGPARVYRRTHAIRHGLNITNSFPRKTLTAKIRNRYHILALTDPSFYVASPIEILLRADVCSTFMDGRKITIDNSLSVAYSSIFGWILVGCVF